VVAGGGGAICDPPQAGGAGMGDSVAEIGVVDISVRRKGAGAGAPGGGVGHSGAGGAMWPSLLKVIQRTGTGAMLGTWGDAEGNRRCGGKQVGEQAMQSGAGGAERPGNEGNQKMKGAGR